MHLNADELVDLADLARPEWSAPHLATCEQCRAQLRELRAMMSAVADVEVPEPSPLFWDHFSQRVHDAVVADEADARLKASRSFWNGLGRILGARAFQASVVAVVALVIVVVLPLRVLSPNAPARPLAPPGPPPPVAASTADATGEFLNDGAVESDPSLTLVASLTATLDADATSEAGLAAVGSAEHAVTHMNDAELRELHRLLQEELAP